MSPTHFLDEADSYEIAAFLEGASKRERDGWEQARFVMQAVLNSAGAKIKDTKEVLPFPWDEGHKEVDPEKEYKNLKHLQQFASKVEEQQKIIEQLLQ